ELRGPRPPPAGIVDVLGERRGQQHGAAVGADLPRRGGHPRVLVDLDVLVVPRALALPRGPSRGGEGRGHEGPVHRVLVQQRRGRPERRQQQAGDRALPGSRRAGHHPRRRPPVMASRRGGPGGPPALPYPLPSPPPDRLRLLALGLRVPYPLMADYFDLGSYTRRVTTGSDRAQTWFTRGLLWAYGFNHEEAAACFERAAEADPGCVMAYWGLAYALGPNYNKPWEAFGPEEASSSLSRAAAALTAAAGRAERAAPVERALVHALASRYPAAGTASAGLDLAPLAEPGAAWNAGYAGAMREVYRAHPDDLDVAALFADALLNLTPWALWDRVTGEPAPGAAAVEAKDVLERALAGPDGQAHPGILH